MKKQTYNTFVSGWDKLARNNKSLYGKKAKMYGLNPICVKNVFVTEKLSLWKAKKMRYDFLLLKLFYALCMLIELKSWKPLV